ncbi:MAG TPA: DNA polymerase III subunit delta [Flavobacteriia bacterium]|nr:DNA polymerase III subunit delta [Flavobacteriia bacterium]
MQGILNNIKNRNFKPIYFLMGEESYFIDLISNLIERTVLKEEEKGFNQMVVYGKETKIEDLVANAKRYPMMADYQVIIVKEAQDLSRIIENLTPYVLSPQPTTILVFNYKYKKLDARKKLSKAIKKTGLLFESKKLYENQVAGWINTELKHKGYSINPIATELLVSFLGNNLSKIANELNKLQIVLPKGTLITPDHIEQNIGISKDFNVFELNKAIGKKQIKKANQIINYFVQNEKENPLPVVIGQLNAYFTKLLLLHGLKDKSQNNAASKLKVHPFFVKEYFEAIRNYPMRKVAQIIGHIHQADMKSKGVGASGFSQKDILKELLFKILH